MAREDIVLAISTPGAAKSTQEVDRLTKSMKDLRRQTVETRGALLTLGRIVVPALMFKAAQGVVQLTDAFTNLQNKIRVVTKGQDALNYITHELTKIANESRTSLEGVATVYSRTARAVEVLGKSQQETLQFTKTLSKAVAIGGSTAVEASNAMIQLSQGLSSGTLRGDELRSVLEQLPVVADLIADKMGVTIGELRKLGAAGKLTSKEVFDAIVAGAADIDARFEKMKPTFSQAWQVLKNEAIIATQSVQESVGKLSQFVLKLAKNFDLLVDAAEAAARVVGVAFAVTAIGAAIRGINMLTVALARNPFAVIAAGIATVIAALGPFADRIQIANEKTLTLRDIWTAWAEKAHPLLRAWGESMQKFLIDPMAKFQENMEKVLLFYAKAADVIHIMANPEVALGAGMAKINQWRGSGSGTDMPDGVTRNEDAVKSMMARARALGMGRTKDEFWEKQNETESRFNAFMADRMPGAHKAGKLPPPTVKTSGKSMEDLLREMRQDIEVLRSPSTEERNIQKIKEAIMDQLGKGHKSTPTQERMLEELIRIREDLKLGMKISEEMGKDISEKMTKALEERKEAMTKASEEAGLRVAEGRNAAAAALRESDAATSRSLNPLADYQERVQQLEDFKLRHTAMADQIDSEILKMHDGYQKIAPIFDSMGASLADAAANAIIFGDNLSQALENIAKSLMQQSLSALFQIGMNAAVGAIGGPVLPGMPGSMPGRASGGYTGDGPVGQAAGMYHGKEYVVNSNATARHRATLEAMNAGRSFPGSDGGGAPKITVNNYGDSSVSVEQVSRDEITIMIEKGVKQHAPKAVAADMRGANSQTNKAVRQSFQTRPKR